MVTLSTSPTVSPRIRWLSSLVTALLIVAFPGSGESQELAGLYQIKVQKSGRLLQVDAKEGGDQLVSTRDGGIDRNRQFQFQKNGDGSFTIRSSANNIPVHVDGEGDQIASTRLNANDDYTKYFLQRQQDGSYRIQLKATRKFLRVDGERTRLLSTLSQANDGYSRFSLVPVGGQQNPMPLQGTVTGLTMVSVEKHAAGELQGHFRATGPKTWVEQYSKTGATREWTVVGKNETSVFLTSGGVGVQLDLTTMSVLLSTDGFRKSSRIFELKNPVAEAPPEPRKPLVPVIGDQWNLGGGFGGQSSSAGVTGHTLIKVEKYSTDGSRLEGYFRYTGGGEWMEERVNNGGTRVWAETNRTDRAVSLKSGSARIRLDVETEAAWYSDSSGRPEWKLYTLKKLESGRSKVTIVNQLAMPVKVTWSRTQYSNYYGDVWETVNGKRERRNQRPAKNTRIPIPNGERSVPASEDDEVVVSPGATVTFNSMRFRNFLVLPMSTTANEEKWEDSVGQQFGVVRTANAWQVRMITPSGRRFWTEATGTDNQGTIVMRHSKNRRFTNQVNGKLSPDRNSITWENGTTWKQVTAAPNPVTEPIQDFTVRSLNERVVVGSRRYVDEFTMIDPNAPILDPIGRQSLNSCVAWSICGSLGTHFLNKYYEVDNGSRIAPDGSEKPPSAAFLKRGVSLFDAADLYDQRAKKIVDGKVVDGGWRVPDALKVCEGYTVRFRNRNHPLTRQYGVRISSHGGWRSIWSRDEMRFLIYRDFPLIAAFSTFPDRGYFSQLAKQGKIYQGPNVSRIDGPAFGHAVLAVGYGSEKTLGPYYSNSYRGDDYWLIHNSWGKSFGTDGYVKFGEGVCAIDDRMYAITNWYLCDLDGNPVTDPQLQRAIMRAAVGQ